MIEFYEKNEIGTDWICGDIHGYFSALEDALIEIGFDKTKDRLFCCGDLVDRGPESKDAVYYLDQPWFYSVVGNHENMTTRHFTYGESSTHIWNGGHWFTKLTENQKLITVSAFLDLPHVIELKDDLDRKIVVAHADLPVNDYDEIKTCLSTGYITENLKHTYFDLDHLLDMIIWSRNRIKRNIKDNIDGCHKVFLGHTIVDEPRSLGNCVYLDTGIYRTGKISFYNLKTEEIKVVYTGTRTYDSED